MQTTRTYTQRLTLDTPFHAVADDTLLGILREKYTGRCFRECFVTEVTRVVAKGDIKITQSHPPRGNIDVKFQIEGRVMPPGYIATDCLIVGVDGGLAIIQNEFMCGMIPLTNRNDFLKKDMIVPVRVINSKYNSEKITASCVLFTHAEPWPAYHITAAGSSDIHWRELYETARGIAEEIADQRFSVARALAMPVKAPAGAAIAIEQLDGVVCLNPSLEINAIAAPPNCHVIHCSKAEAAARILTDYIMYAGLIKFIGNTYNTKAATDLHKLYVLALNKSKAQALN
jgi:hypothetical protein